MNKFEQVSSLGHLYNEFQCIMGNGHMGPPPVDRTTDGHTAENITANSLAVGNKRCF